MRNIRKTGLSGLLASTMLSGFVFVSHAVAQEGEPQPENSASESVVPEVDLDISDEIVIRGILIPDSKKATSEIASFLDVESFERAGDSDIAAALRRVTGLSVNDGRFVIVRGLNERYSSATLNGLPLPSPEPLRRAAPLDLFPTSVLESTLVQKTYSPQYSGEFGGGLVELRTKKIPAENFLTIGADMTVNTVTSLQDGLFHDGSDTDRFGFDDGLREFPDEVTALFTSQSVSPDVQNAADTSFDQSKTLLISEEQTPVNGGASISIGRILHEGTDMNVGTVLYVGYDNDFETREGDRFSLEGTNSSTSNFFQTRQEIGIAGLSSTGFEFGDDHELGITGLLVRKSLKRTEIEEEFFNADDRTFLREKTSFIERQLWQGQLTGEHTLPALADMEVSWQAAYGEAERDAPYGRETGRRLDESTGDYLFTVEEGVTNIDFRYLKDQNAAAGIDFKLPLTIADQEVDIAFGADYTNIDRESSRRLFEVRGVFPTEVIGSRADLVLSDPILNLDDPKLLFRSTAGEPDNFEGSLEVMAAYASADIELGPYLRAAIGARYEEGTQETATFLTRTPDNKTAFAPIEEDYVLPAATITWNPTGNFQLRAGVSQTFTRPQFRELSPSIFTDPDTDISYVGNPFLQNTEIENYDIRAEWYFSRGEFVTFGLFYKDMQNPIEEAIVTQGESIRTTFVNAPMAELQGVEFEFEKKFDFESFFGNTDFAYGKEMFLATNYTYTQGEVSDEGDIVIPEISGQGVSAGAPRDASANIKDGSNLVGLSEHLFNFQIGVETEDGTKATLLANYASERTLVRGEATSGGNFLPAIIEQPPVSLDFVVNQSVPLFGAGYDLTLKFQNLLNEDYNAFYESGDDVSIDLDEASFQRYDRGRTVAIGLKRTF